MTKFVAGQFVKVIKTGDIVEILGEDLESGAIAGFPPSYRCRRKDVNGEEILSAFEEDDLQSVGTKYFRLNRHQFLKHSRTTCWFQMRLQ